VNPNNVFLQEKRYLRGICYTNEDFEVVLSAMANGSLNADDMVTGVVSLPNAVSGAFEELISRNAQHVKILVH